MVIGASLPSTHGAGGGWGPPPGVPPGAPGPPPGAPGGFAPSGGAPHGFAPPGAPGGSKPITGSPQTMAMYAATLDPKTGLPAGERPPASTAAVVALVCGILLCLGPLTGVPAIVAGAIGIKKANDDPANVGGRGLSIAGIVLGVVNLLVTLLYLIFGVLVAL